MPSEIIDREVFLKIKIWRIKCLNLTGPSRTEADNADEIQLEYFDDASMREYSDPPTPGENFWKPGATNTWVKIWGFEHFRKNGDFHHLKKIRGIYSSKNPPTYRLVERDHLWGANDFIGKFTAATIQGEHTEDLEGDEGKYQVKYRVDIL